MNQQFRKWGEKHAPCKGCPDRHVGCHSVCDRYKEFKEQNDAERKKRSDVMRLDDQLFSVYRGGRKK